MYLSLSRRDSIDEKDGGRTATLFHAVSHRDCGPVSVLRPGSEQSAHVVPDHEQMI